MHAASYNIFSICVSLKIIAKSDSFLLFQVCLELLLKGDKVQVKGNLSPFTIIIITIITIHTIQHRNKDKRRKQPQSKGKITRHTDRWEWNKIGH